MILIIMRVIMTLMMTFIMILMMMILSAMIIFVLIGLIMLIFCVYDVFEAAMFDCFSKIKNIYVVDCSTSLADEEGLVTSSSSSEY